MLKTYNLALLMVLLTSLFNQMATRIIGYETSIVLFTGSVAVSARYGGFKPGLFALALAALMSSLPTSNLPGSPPAELADNPFLMVVFFLQGLLICSLIGSLHTQNQRRARLALERGPRGRTTSPQATEERYRRLVEAVEDYAIFMLSPDGRITSWNSGAERIIGYREEEILDHHVSRLYSEKDIRRRKPDLELQKAVQAGRCEEEGWRVRKNGDKFWANVIITPLYDGLSFTGFAKITRDITKRKRAEAKLIYQGTHDALTGLPNRTQLMQALEENLETNLADEGGFALLLLDLDGFKQINDTYGHLFGDAVLQQLRPLLLGAVRKSDTVARLGGDEFGILLAKADRQSAIAVADRILSGLAQPIVVEGQALQVGGSIGISLHPEHGLDVATLLDRADMAMYAAKRGRLGKVIGDIDSAEHTPCLLKLSADPEAPNPPARRPEVRLKRSIL
ncbi:diguanylate cyclase domain-containing protein [Singulisphaera sp. PoT]|uniref:diguanylate cyclase domain-containing protein n=1 Tax=Singulisphaera sp. PoT TaxID=3411797 RepID=UPI003BF59AFD